MYDAAATTEVVYYASKSLTGMRCIYQHRQQAPRGYGAIRPSDPVTVCCCCDHWQTDKRPRVTRERVREARWFGWFSAFGWLREVLPSLSAKQLVKAASTFLSAFRLPPRLGGVYIRRVHPHASRRASQKSGLPTRMNPPLFCTHRGQHTSPPASFVRS